MNRRAFQSVLRRSLEQMDLAERVATALSALSPRSASTLARRLVASRVHLIAIGKAAPAMAAGAIDVWSDAIATALVVTTDGTDVSPIVCDPRVTVLRAGHPLPDLRSRRAAEDCLARARACRVADGSRANTLLVLVSGGASALVCAPAENVLLSDKRAVTRRMLLSGATIQEINIVRKHLSRIKGGGLARAARPADVVTLVASDVIGGRVADVGSGPSIGDDSSVARARALLRRHAPRYANLPLVRTGRAPNAGTSQIVASPEELARVVAVELRRRGLRARMLEPSQTRVEELADEYVKLAARLAPNTALVRAAEPSLEAPRRAGRGGRSTHLATLVGRALPPGVTFVAAATDGVDGTSGTAGAVVDARFLRRAGEDELARAVARYDTGTLHRALGTAIPMRPTGHNLADVHVLVRARTR